MKIEELTAWAEAACAAGWLDSQQLGRIQGLETQEAEQLFISQGQRPLLVALFGGTGAGKSSLINRLAGRPIARTGIERPTSHEVSLYLHQDFHGIQLAAELPLERTNIAWHQDDKRRLLAWIDMPDFDSTALENRALVEAWLPYIDWIFYVVTPERYRDALGWHFLLERRDRHRWLFVMNHWDQGQQAQLDDFRQQLEARGFEQPCILRTACVTPAIADDFKQLEASINEAIDGFGLDWLQKQGLRARQDELLSLARELAQALGSQTAWNQWQQQSSDFLQGWQEAFDQDVQQDAAGQLGRLLQKKTGLDELPSLVKPLLEPLLGPRTLERLAEPGLWQTNLAFGLGLPAQVLVQEMPASADSLQQLRQQLEKGLAAAIAQPGSRGQRALLRQAGILAWLLPLLAGAWVSWELVQGYYLATTGQKDYEGINFAIHSGLLLAGAWLLPYLAMRQLRPRPRQVMLQGIAQGLQGFKAHYLKASQALWKRIEQQRQGWQQQLLLLISRKSDRHP